MVTNCKVREGEPIVAQMKNMLKYSRIEEPSFSDQSHQVDPAIPGGYNMSSV
jgi:hypothetical protein